MDTIITLQYLKYEENIIVDELNVNQVVDIIQYDAECKGVVVKQQGDFLFKDVVTESQNIKSAKRSDWLDAKVATVYAQLSKMQKRSFDFTDREIERKEESLSKWECKLLAHYETMTHYAFSIVEHDSCASFEDVNSSYYEYK